MFHISTGLLQFGHVVPLFIFCIALMVFSRSALPSLCHCSSPHSSSPDEEEDELLKIVADRLCQNKVVGWMQGKAEWGPRALGNRSILATPLGKNIKRIVNEKIKFREPYRPFAPAVTIENYEEFFDVPKRDEDVGIPELYMLSICKVKKKWREYLPAITHVDGSARVQFVKKTMNLRFHKLLSTFGKNTGFPIILNTSFNLNGEPIVNNANDAIHTFNYSDLDCLILGNFLVEK